MSEAEEEDACGVDVHALAVTLCLVVSVSCWFLLCEPCCVNENYCACRLRNQGFYLLRCRANAN